MATLPTRAAQTARASFDPAAVGAWLVPFALVLYLGLNNGGYDIVERSQAGIAVWWIVLVGTAVGVLPAAGGTTAGRVMFAVLGAFALWTALGLSWTESAERTSIELGRVAAYLGVFALALAVQGSGRWRHLLGGATAGVACIVAIAALSRLEPSWFPERQTGRFLPGVDLKSRLAYPLNYSSGLAALTAASLPLLLRSASSARLLALRGLAAAAISVSALTLWWTGSGLSVPLSAIGLAAFLAMAPDRLPKVASLAPGAVGGAVAIAAASQRDALDQGLTTHAAGRQGDEMLAIMVVICVVVALSQVGIAGALRRLERSRWLVISPRKAAAALAVAVVLAVVVAVAAGAPGKLSNAWDDFRYGEQVDPTSAARTSELLDVSSSERYRYWQAATDANATEPLVGIGPGTYEFWWSRNGSIGSFVRDAHSLYLETLAELGIVGLLLIVTFTGAVLVLGVMRLARASPELRVGLATATAGCAVLIAGATVDWLWELAAIQVVFWVLAAIAIAGGSEEGARSPAPNSPRSPARHIPAAAMIALSVVALVAITIPLAGTSAIQSSRSDAADGRLDEALGEARAAQRIQPYAATPRLQEALVLEREGDLDGAVDAAEKATARESTNWRVWVVLSRLEARRGDVQASIEAYRTARSLNPLILPG